MRVLRQPGPVQPKNALSMHFLYFLPLPRVEAATEAEAIAKGAEEFNQPKERLMVVRRV
jgi:hypothetical protein